MRSGDDPGLPRWSLNIIACIFIRRGKRRFDHQREGHVAEEVETGMVRPQAKECQKPLETRSGKKKLKPPGGVQPS